MLALSTLYIGWSFAAKHHAQGVAREVLANQGIAYDRIVTLASPFNTVLWRIVAMGQQGYHVGWYSLLDPGREVRFERHRSDPLCWPASRTTGR